MLAGISMADSDAGKTSRVHSLPQILMCVHRDLRMNWKHITTNPLHAVIPAIISMKTSDPLNMFTLSKNQKTLSLIPSLCDVPLCALECTVVETLVHTRGSLLCPLFLVSESPLDAIGTRLSDLSTHTFHASFD